MHGCQIEAKKSWMCVRVCTVSICVFRCPGAGGWESGGVQKAFFHRWIERTAFTNGLFSAQASGCTSCLVVRANSVCTALNL